MRINSASDDAAGLAISENLKADSRVLAQGVRNINDGISFINIADAALGSLSEINTRLTELAEQGANGTYSRTQRKALHDEARALTHEYNRIIETSKFNGVQVFSGTGTSNLRLQAGYGEDGGLGIDVGKDLGRNAGTGTFSTSVTSTDAGNGVDMQFGDLNNDGIADMVTSPFDRGRQYIHLGNGDGTFRAAVSYVTGSTPRGTRLGDFNGDGNVDIGSIDNSGYATFLLGNGDGTFRAHQTLNSLQVEYALGVGDFNDDGYDDFIGGGTYLGTDRTMIYYGSASGLQAGQSLGITPRVVSVEKGDFNNDGKEDFVYGTYVAGTYQGINLALSNGDGTFNFSKSFSGWGESIKVGDFNADGIDDVAYGNRFETTVRTALGNGDGTFKAAISHQTIVSARETYITDLNGDGKDDLVIHVATATNDISTLLGNGDGTFTMGSTRTTPTYGRLAFADVNSDGVMDLGTYSPGNGAIVYLGDKTKSQFAPWLDLTTQESSRDSLTILRQQQDRISLERGSLGAFQSRLAAASSVLSTTRENYLAAESRIRDSDTAADAAELTKTKILQQVATAVLAQSNQNPALALKLLT